MKMHAGNALRRIADNSLPVAGRLLNPRGCYGAKLALLIGVGYPFGPIDIIPNSLPVVGYLDQVAFVLGGPVVAYLLLARPARRRDAASAVTRGFAKRARAWLLDGFAAVFAVPMLRLATGAWPQKAEVASFRHAFRRFTPLPPLMRALSSVPAGREQLTRAMLASWLLADEAYRGRLARDLAGDDARIGNPLRVWSGPKVTFLHIEKTAGMAMVAALAAQFHPLQIDADVRRAHPPHLFCHLPPFLLPQVRRRALVWGHYDVPSIDRLGEERFTFTMLREPRKRIRSLYRYWRAQAALDLGWNGMNQPVLLAQRLDFDAFLQTNDPMVVNYLDNLYVRRLTGQYATDAGDPLADDPDRWLQAALDTLARLDFVGLTEDMDGALARLGAMLDFVPPRHVARVNVTHAAVTVDAAADAALERLTALDMIVYTAAVERHAGQESKQFFFEKKNQKTFVTC